jgi:basic membrane protein A
MSPTPIRTTFAAVLAAGVAVAATACSAAPDDSGASASGAAASEFKPCIVSSIGGFDDRAFNQLNLEGVQGAADELGVEIGQAASNSSDQYDGNISAMIDNGCTLVVTIGFDMATATREAAKNNPDTEFVIVDSALSEDNGDPLTLDNVKPVLYNTAEASYLAGYVAAAASKTGVVGTFGGMQIPPVTAFMDGFAQGVAKYNEAHGANVKVLGWDDATQNGLFVGNFTDTTQASALSQSLLDQGADVIMPVAGTLVSAAATPLQDSGSDIALVGVDSDGYVLNTDFQDLFLTSVLKNMAITTKDVVLEAAKGDFSSDTYTGTLSNEGVGIAPLHDRESSVDPAVLDEVAALQKQIADGEIIVTTGK